MKRIASFFLAALLLLTLSACGSKKTAAGYYKLTKYTMGGKEMTPTDTERYLVLEEDGTGALVMDELRRDVTWNESSIVLGEQHLIPYTWNEDTIVVSDSGEEMTFVRLTKEELDAYQALAAKQAAGETAPDNGAENAENAESSGENDLVLQPSDGFGMIDHYFIDFLGAEAVQSADGKPAVRVWFEFDNNTDYVVSPSADLLFSIHQGNYYPEPATPVSSVPEDSYYTAGVAPGCITRCALVYYYEPSGGPIEATICNHSESRKVSGTYDPANLPGAPADTFVMEPCEDMSEYMQDIPLDDKNAEILGLERAKNADGEDLLIVRLRFTNNGSRAVSFFNSYIPYVMQGNYGLVRTELDSEAEALANWTAPVQPGATIECCRIFKLREEGPVAVLLCSKADGSYFGQIFEHPGF